MPEACFHFDLVIKGGKVLDGTGSPWRYMDIGVKDGRIAALVRASPGQPSLLDGVPARDGTLDATGLMAAPGFIDMHSHSDLTLITNPTSDGKVLQGVTTEVIGQCGFSAAPLTERTAVALKATLGETADIDAKWRSFGEFADRVQSQGASANTVGLVGHGTVRTIVMGFKAALSTEEELEAMKALVEGAMQDGAFGFSSGLIYTPGSYSDTREVLELARVAARYHGIYFTHMRSESGGLLKAVSEAVDIGRGAGIPVQISHMKCAGAAQGLAKEYLAAVETARECGIDVTGDQYPYTAGATGLAALLPPWAHEGGGERMVERLLDPATRVRLKSDMQRSLPGWDNDFQNIGFDKILVAASKDESIVGHSLQEIADERGGDPYETLFDILGKTDPGSGMVIFLMTDEDVKEIMRHETVMIGSDAAAGKVERGRAGHPRAFGTFPRVLGPFVRNGTLTLPQAVFKMTGLPAAKLGLQDRGLLREGFAADLVLFDPNAISDRATYQKAEYPVGISHVLVNGCFVVKDGVHTGAKPGRFLRR